VHPAIVDSQRESDESQEIETRMITRCSVQQEKTVSEIKKRTRTRGRAAPAKKGLSVRSGQNKIVIADNTRYHHARLRKGWRDDHRKDFMLDYLPSYSPELNPIERVWKLTRRQCIPNRYFPALEAVVAAVETQFGYWANGNEILSRLCAIT
jgi:hypothetical protein